MASVAWASFMYTASLALSSSSLQQESIVALVMNSCSRAAFICPYSESTSSGRSVGPTPGGAWGCGMGEVPATSSVFWHSRWGWWVTDMSDTGDVTSHGCLWRHLHRGYHWTRDGQVHPLQAEGIFCSGGGQRPQGCQWQLPSWHTMLRDRGWGCGGSPLQPLQGPLNV